MAAVEAIASGRLSDCISMVLARPPGHHAFPSRGSGFCLLNNIAIAAMSARRRFGINRIVIIDWDVHHGNGTQAIFDTDPDVFYISIHQYPHYPGTGVADDIGGFVSSGSSQTATRLNIPLPPGCGDTEYLGAFDEIIIPAVRRYKPELVLVSAGYDGHWADPLSDTRLSVSGYAAMTQRVKQLAIDCGGPLALFLEGGYHTGALAASVAATLSVLLDDTFDDPIGPPPDKAEPPEIAGLIAKLKSIHQLW